MKTRNLIIPALFLFIYACANNEHESAKAINEACTFEMQAAQTAVALRNKNKPKSILLSKLTPLEKDSSRLLVNMYQIVDEVYQYRWLNEVIYPTYRFELCQRQLQYKSYPITIKPVIRMLNHCQKKFASEASEQATNCIIKGLNNYAETKR